METTASNTNTQSERTERKPVIGITIGDINGIGLEVILKALSHPRILQICVPIIYGSSKVVSYHKNVAGLEEFSYQNLRSAERPSTERVNVLNCWNENVNITLGKPSEAGGKYAMISLESAIKDLRAGLIDAIVTGPIHKKSMELAGFGYIGHTEYLAKAFNVSDCLMLMVSSALKVGLVTTHVPLRDVPLIIDKERIIRKLEILEQSLKVDFGYERPLIAVLGLNPHAGEEGLLGDEEEKVIRPAVVECKKKGMNVFGPFPADGFFGAGKFNKFDAVLAMYHDQGLIAFKSLTFGSGVNYTAGLPIIRTSPDHGTAFELTGKNEADHSSFLQAIFTAIDIWRNRTEYNELRSNAVKRVEVEEETEEGEVAISED
ncbi:MAG: 4-hydroxythreonine-4-phosphate dehydrogenase [Saprospiraceae bacterium]|nr:MAG: 4-hydroxythreonine-4-phosphate dehydrogenase [Saprospiraceae bacterium]